MAHRDICACRTDNVSVPLVRPTLKDCAPGNGVFNASLVILEARRWKRLSSGKLSLKTSAKEVQAQS